MISNVYLILHSVSLKLRLPNAPSGLTASNVTDTGLTISWDAVSYNEGIENYEVFRNGSSLGTRKGTSYADSGLSPETTYQYQVRTAAANGLVSGLSVALSVTTNTAPEPPPEAGEG